MMFNIVHFSLCVFFRLDRELTSHYRLHVITWDGGSPQQTGTLTIDVQVVDDNDNPPRFTNSTYTATVSENVEAMTSLVQVQALDDDEGRNSHVTYKFGRQTQNLHGDLFRIDAQTGVISALSVLDRDSTSAAAYHLSVEATDGGTPPLTDFATVVIHVADENDNAPRVSINSFSTSGQVEVPENAANGTFIAQILVTDPDVGANGFVQCDISSDLFALRQPYSGEYQLITAAIFDREAQAQYGVMLECLDRGDPPQVTRQPITVHVTDVNDQAPRFETHQYNVTVLENNPLGEQLVTVHATDDDIGVNAEVTYSLLSSGSDDGSGNDARASSPPPPLLTVDSQTGAVYASVSFDRETQSFYR